MTRLIKFALLVCILVWNVSQKQNVLPVKIENLLLTLHLVIVSLELLKILPIFVFHVNILVNSVWIMQENAQVKIIKN